jgi:hypothetical protein
MRQLKGIKVEDIVFLDIETAPLVKELEEGTPIYEAWKYAMERKVESMSTDEKEMTIEEYYVHKAALYPEFSRIVCITVGRVRDGKIVLKTYNDEDEAELVSKFTRDLDVVVRKKPSSRLCGHSVIGFDIPFIFRRCIANQVFPNELVDVAGVKPWEMTALDTKMLWKGTGYYMASLVAVCVALGVESPKSDITGAEVGHVFWNEGKEGLLRISEYCERDVVALINCVLVMMFKDQIFDIEVQEVKEMEPETLLQRIGSTGSISKEDREELLEKASGMDYKSKEQLISMIKGALAMTGSELDQELELKLLM